MALSGRWWGWLRGKPVRFFERTMHHTVRYQEIVAVLIKYGLTDYIRILRLDKGFQLARKIIFRRSPILTKLHTRWQLLRMGLRLSGFEPLRRTLDSISYRLVFGLILSALVVSSSLIIRTDLPPLWMIPVVSNVMRFPEGSCISMIPVSMEMCSHVPSSRTSWYVSGS